MLCLTSFFFYKISYIAFVKMNLNRALLDFGTDSNPRIRLLPGSDFLNTVVSVREAEHRHRFNADSLQIFFLPFFTFNGKFYFFLLYY